jgi:hypothetical protein
MLKRTIGLEDEPDRHPLEVSTHSVHLSLINADLGTVVVEGLLGVAETAEAVAVAVVGDLCFH